MSDELLRAERDLYRRLLDMGAHDELLPFLDEALGLVVEITGARQGYLEVGPAISVAHALSNDDVKGIRERISSGILAEALKTGKTVSTASAFEDPRFSSQKSVQAGRIQAVLCAPIGGVGALYLQGRQGSGAFPEKDRALVELFARVIAPLTDRLLRQHRAAPSTDHTRELRTKLKVDAIAGTSKALADTLQQMLVASGVDITVLLRGESGTGKTELARALHASSRRARGPFVELNCAAIPETLFEAELFGAEKGAHSTATRKMPGKIAAAEHGTLFLDEIGELPPNVQAKLLQFLQSKMYFPLGSSTGLTADVRIIAATNADLEQLVVEKKFREDLFYRINVLTIRVPALRERTDDIPALADHIIQSSSGMFGRTMSLSTGARFALQQTDWPGNVRQLAGAIQRAAALALSEGSEIVDVRHLSTTPATAETGATTYQDALKQFQRAFLSQALDACAGNVSETARRVGLARSHLHELLRTHGLTRTR